MIHPLQFLNKCPYTARVWQCSDFDSHWHRQIEIYICLEGQFTIRVEGKDHSLQPNDVLMLAANEAHRIFCDRTDTKAIILAFGYKLLGRRYEQLEALSFPRPYFSLDDESVAPELIQPLKQLRQHLLASEATGHRLDWLLRSGLYAVAAWCAQLEGTEAPSQERQLRSRQNETVDMILRYISEHYRERITLEQAAALSGYDRSYFCQQFRNAAGITFHQYLNYYRLCIACRKLADPALSIGAVAEEAGFTSHKMMNRLFQSILGVTPTQYRSLPAEQRSSLLPL